MQRTNSEYGSPYLATHHFPFPFFSFPFFLLLFNAAVVHNFSLLILCSFQSLLTQKHCFMTTLHVNTDYKETSGKKFFVLIGWRTCCPDAWHWQTKDCEQQLLCLVCVDPVLDAKTTSYELGGYVKRVTHLIKTFNDATCNMTWLCGLAHWILVKQYFGYLLKNAFETGAFETDYLRK